MKLFYSPGACSLSPHIVLREAGLPFELEKVDTKAGKTAGGADFHKINPKKYVPVLQLDDGELLTEGAIIVQYLADQKPAAQLAPANGSMERYRLQEWLNYIATEIHKGYSPLFRAKTDEQREAPLAALAGKFDLLQHHFAERKFVLGERFTVADAYLFTVLNWSGRVKVDLSKWPAVQAFHQRIFERPTVQAALEAEGLLKR